MKTEQLYVMISRTNTGVGKMIRLFSNYPYNHVSLSLDRTFRSWVSFARYSHSAPLYGGFIREPAERYLADNDDVTVRIFSIPITNEKRQQLEVLFSKTGVGESDLVYNLFDVAAAIIGQEVRICGAYTCLSFACAVIGCRHLTIRDLDQALTPYLIYEGMLKDVVTDSGERNDRYFQKLGVWEATACSVGVVSSLCSRLAYPHKEDLVSRYT